MERLDRSDEHFPEEPELAVPYDGKGREHRRHDDAHGDNAGVDELVEVETADGPDESAHAVAEDEEEQHRLDEAAEDTGPGPDVADELTLPDHPDDA